jgi:ubiquinone/menaquinone biosynthesis C-methylase UbiE
MSASPGRTKTSDKIYFVVWERTGVTEHMGGIEATKTLARMMRINPGQLVLDIGCGTGYTAAYMARELHARVVCMDILPGLLATARERAAREGVNDRVSFVRADAHHLPFKAGVLDRALAESVLVFCKKSQAVGEISRVLKPAGLFGDNELTYLRPPPEELREIFSADRGLGMEPLLENDWKEIFTKADICPIWTCIGRVNFLSQLVDHIRIDGLINYFSSAIRGVSDVRLRKEFFNKYTGKSGRKFSSYTAYGLYVGEKSSGSCARDGSH